MGGVCLVGPWTGAGQSHTTENEFCSGGTGHRSIPLACKQSFCATITGGSLICRSKPALKEHELVAPFVAKFFQQF